MADSDEARTTRRRSLLVLSAIVGGALALLALLYLQPWSGLLGEDDDTVLPGGLTVEAERAMRQAAETDREGSDPIGLDGVVELSRGPFSGRSGQVVEAGELVVLGGPNGERLVRIEGLDMTNGPDLHVELSTAPPDALTPEFGFERVDLGELVYNVGDSTYTVPAEFDVANYRSVTIWCQRYDVNYAVAPISLQEPPPPDTTPSTTEAGP